MNRRPHEEALGARWILEGEIPLAGVADGSSWHRARSVDSGETAALFLVPGAAAAETADAARRAYLVENPRLLPITQIELFEADPQAPAGSIEAIPLAAVAYPFPPAPPLAALVAHGPLRPETARSVIAEAATGLEAARRRGLRHVHLDSNRVFADTATGAVWVLGVGVETAAHLDQDPMGEEAARRDVFALVSLLYRAIAGRAPSADGSVAEPSSVAERRVPADLDGLCARVLNGAPDAPSNVRELIEELSPWQSIPVTLEAYDASDRPAGVEPAGGQTQQRPAVAADEAPTDGGSAAAAAPEIRGPEAPSPETASTPGAAGERPGPGTAALPVDPDQPSGPAEAETAADEGAAGTRRGGTARVGAFAAALGAAARGRAAALRGGRGSSRSGATEHDGGDPSPATAATGGSTAAVAAPASETATSTEGSAREDAVRETAPASQPTDEPTHDDATSREARELVEELHLTDRRSGAAFPGALDIEPAPSRLPEPVDIEPDAHADRTTGSAHDDDHGVAALQPAGDPGRAPAVLPGRTAHDHATPDEAATRDAHGSERSEVVAAAVPADDAAPQGPIVVPGRSTPIPDRPSAWESTSGGRSSSFREVMGVALDSDAERPYDATPREEGARSRQAQWVLIGALLLVIIALVLAITSITAGLRNQASASLGTTAPAATSAAPTAAPATTEAAPAATTEAAPSPAAAPAAPPTLAGATVQSDGTGDHPEDGPRLNDANPGTVWRSKNYTTAAFGNLKQGIAIGLDLTAPATVNGVVVTTVGSPGGSIELHTVNPDGSMGGAVASGAFSGGEVRLAPDQPLESTQKLALWIPQLPPDGGGFRAQIAELGVE